MAIKADVQGLLIYGVMLAYLAAFVALACRSKKLGYGFYILGFVVALAAFVYRWQHVAHVPLQNLFEVFLFLGVLALPLSVFCRRFLGVGGETVDPLLGFIILFPAGFVFHAEPQKLPAALQSWLFAPHVATYMLAYLILIKASVQACGQLILRDRPEADGLISRELATYRTIRLGFPVLTLGLVLGAWWGKIAWGDYWNWDPKEMWSLITWLVYLGYLHFRYTSGIKRPRVNSALAICGSLAIVITLLWANLSRIFAGLHSYAS